METIIVPASEVLKNTKISDRSEFVNLVSNIVEFFHNSMVSKLLGNVKEDETQQLKKFVIEYNEFCRKAGEKEIDTKDYDKMSEEIFRAISARP